MRMTDLSIHTQPLGARSFSTSCTTFHPLSANLVQFAYLQTISCNHSCSVHGILCTWNFALHVNSSTFYKHLPALLVTHSIFHNPPLIYDTIIFVPVNDTEGQDRPFFNVLGKYGRGKKHNKIPYFGREKWTSLINLGKFLWHKKC